MRGYDNLGSKIIQVEKDGGIIAIVRKVHRHRRTANTIARWDKHWNFVEHCDDGAWRKVVDKRTV